MVFSSLICTGRCKRLEDAQAGRKRMKHLRPLVIGMLVVMMGWGCAARVSPSTPHGAYLNLYGEAVNAYKGPPAITIQASLEILAFMNISILSRRGGRHETIITGQAPDGSPLRLRFVDQGHDLTLLLIRTGTVGFWDYEFSLQLHALLYDRLMRKRQPDTEPDPLPEPASAIPPKEAGTGSAVPRAAPPAAPPTPPPKRVPPPAAESRGEPKPDKPAARSAGALPSPPHETAVPPHGTPPDAAVFFDADSNLPEPQERTKLDRVALQVLADPSLKIMLTGFAGRTENEGRAGLVSENRLLAVKFYLIGRGVSAERITAVAHEVIGGDTPSDSQRMRRVEIRFYSEP